MDKSGAIEIIFKSWCLLRTSKLISTAKTYMNKIDCADWYIDPKRTPCLIFSIFLSVSIFQA